MIRTAVSCMFVAACAQAWAAERPNLMVILCDDIGAQELALYGHPVHDTPNLDELGRSGIWFTTGFATPICHPTRFEIMTGQYAHHTGVYQFPGRPGGPPAIHANGVPIICWEAERCMSRHKACSKSNRL
ncbi:MAG: sulfatase-like hydrolase/transferase [Planctomycetales bacterium]|nr:sulfatase-like hydrolase/transferase [Planctomycetales bacterium]